MMQPGFGDAVAEAQACFRAVLAAMAHPGRMQAAGGSLTPPEALAPATAAVLLTLADHETPLWLAPEFCSARDWIAFHCGAPVLADPAACAFAVSRDPLLDALPSGSHEMPERSATLILQLPALGHGVRYRLAGPGLREPAELRIDGLPDGFCAAWERNHAQFPCGVDVILCAGAQLAALPRSVTLQDA